MRERSLNIGTPATSITDLGLYSGTQPLTRGKLTIVKKLHYYDQQINRKIRISPK